MEFLPGRPSQFASRLKAIACIAFVAFHLGATLLRGSPRGLRDHVLPWLAWYTEGLRMATSWGMFSKPPDPAEVVVMGITRDGQREELSHADAKRRDLVRRIVDVRLRKIQNQLDTEQERAAWGKHYLASFCRSGALAGRPLKRVELELVEHPADATLETADNPARRKRVLTRKCAQ